MGKSSKSSSSRGVLILGVIIVVGCLVVLAVQYIFHPFGGNTDTMLAMTSSKETQLLAEPVGQGAENHDIHIVPAGRLGNILFELTAAEAHANEFEDVNVHVYSTPELRKYANEPLLAPILNKYTSHDRKHPHEDRLDTIPAIQYAPLTRHMKRYFQNHKNRRVRGDPNQN